MSKAETADNGKRCWVVKLGSALLTDDGCGLRTEAIADWVAQMAQLRGRGFRFIIVSSGAIAEGRARLGWNLRRVSVHEQQAAAAVGQMGLIQAYESAFQGYSIHTAQMLLTHDDVADRKRYLNARSTLRTLLELGVVPIINENDSVATDEIRFGDNDTLAGLVANLAEADRLIILTDQAGLYDRDPGEFPDAGLIRTGQAGDPALLDCAGPGGALGRGGMLTKLKAAETAAKSGTETVICSGLEADVLLKIAAGEQVGTLLGVARSPLAARKQWLAGHKRPAGTLVLDDGACKVLAERGSSLLAVGIIAVHGEFNRGEIVSCAGRDGREVARGLANYNAGETRRIMGRSSDSIEELLGYVDDEELIHRDNMVIFRD
ncbi:MAG: glutamate 5-kinase [Gammaproteobacteria bacterium]|nr:glutamate 5-kinase [Gammaproteobacteria bacterium]